jgi:hypothetical protein
MEVLASSRSTTPTTAATITDTTSQTNNVNVNNTGLTNGNNNGPVSITAASALAKPTSVTSTPHHLLATTATDSNKENRENKEIKEIISNGFVKSNSQSGGDLLNMLAVYSPTPRTVSSSYSSYRPYNGRPAARKPSNNLQFKEEGLQSYTDANGNVYRVSDHVYMDINKPNQPFAIACVQDFKLVSYFFEYVLINKKIRVLTCAFIQK